MNKNNTRVIDMPQLIIFDMDGLMFDTERLFMKFLIEAASEAGYIFTKELYLKTIGTSGDILRKILREHLGDNYPCVEISRAAQSKLFDYMNSNVLPIKPGLIELLDFLKKKKTPCCVASSTKTEYVKKYLQNASVYDYFSYIVGGDMVSHSKPDPEIFITVYRHFNVSANDALVLEDSLNGIKAASCAGIPVICVPDLIEPDEYMTSHSAAILNQLDDLITMLI